MDYLINTSWKTENEVIRCIIYPIVRIAFLLRSVKWGRGWRFYGVPIVQKHRRSRITIGDNIQLRSTASSNPLGANHPVILCTWQAGAVLEIGDNFGMTGGTICAAERITIGNRVTVGANTTIIDTDFHPLEPVERRLNPQAAHSAPIVIEDDVFIGMNCLILKGVWVGHSSVVGAGSVVTRDVPEGTIVAGNPARVIGQIGSMEQ